MDIVAPVIPLDYFPDSGLHAQNDGISLPNAIPLQILPVPPSSPVSPETLHHAQLD
ncbi:hypothetical protein RISK_004048 [Rhodopirellula islandica]|uniref:Uncharacterized protein n=1 Tax=Rhodopirellula islandica TaxID=595434 RepID=A0A0J1BAX0_RHOIS|nr:hypothetical protein RISK_004048 [Rhodopirellula islandica]